MTTLAPRLVELGLDLPPDQPFTTAQARAAGVHDMRLHRLVNAGVLRRPLTGVYVASQTPDSIELRCAALALVLPRDAFVCDRTAAWIYTGAGAVGPNEHLAVPPVSCFRPSGRGVVEGGGLLSGERRVWDGDLREVNGLVVTTELRTALDLGRLEQTRDMRLWGMDNMLRTGSFGHDELLAEVPRFRGARGVVLLRELAPRADGLSESFGESALRNRWYAAGLPRPQLQIPIHVGEREVARLDLGLEEWRFAAEYDGEEWHTDEDDVTHDLQRREWLRSSQRWEVEVFRRDHVFGRRQNADARLRRAAHEARASFGRRLFIV